MRGFHGAHWGADGLIPFLRVKMSGICFFHVLFQSSTVLGWWFIMFDDHGGLEIDRIDYIEVAYLVCPVKMRIFLAKAIDQPVLVRIKEWGNETQSWPKKCLFSQLS